MKKTYILTLKKLEAENKLISAKLLLIEKELFSRENDLSNDERTISTLRDQIAFLKENIESEEIFQQTADQRNPVLSTKKLTDEEWESIKGFYQKF